MLNRQRPALVVGHLQVVLVKEPDALPQVGRQAFGIADGRENATGKRVGEGTYKGEPVVIARDQIRTLAKADLDRRQAVTKDPDGLVEQTVSTAEDRLLAPTVGKAKPGSKEIRGRIIQIP